MFRFRELFFVVCVLAACSVGGLAQDNGRFDAQVTDLPIPDYPIEAKRTGLSGTVRVAVEVDERGRVISANTVSGPDWICPGVSRADVMALRNAAETAALKATFLPGTNNGKPAKSKVTVSYNFGAPSTTSDANPTSFDARVPVSTVNDPQNLQPNKPSVIAGGDITNKARNLRRPDHPAAARAARVAGAVEVRVLVDTDGTVISAAPVGGHPLLRESAREAACSARFDPAASNGQPIKILGTIVFNFAP